MGTLRLPSLILLSVSLWVLLNLRWCLKAIVRHVTPLRRELESILEEAGADTVVRRVDTASHDFRRPSVGAAHQSGYQRLHRHLPPAGGGAVLTLLGMPAAQHLFERVWALSPALGDVSLARAENIAAQLAELAGVPATRDGFASVDPDALIGLQQTVSERGGARLSGIRSLLDDGLPWGPLVDGDLLTTTTPESIASGVGANKPLVVGSTDDEFTMIADDARGKLRFVPATVALGALGVGRPMRRGYLSDNAEQHRLGTAALLGRYVSDKVFRSGVVRIAAARGEAPTWVYRFSWASTRIGWACHCVDVPFWFDVLDRERVDALTGDDPPQLLADAVHGAASAFVRVGDPGWEKWSAEPGRTRIFDATGPGTIADGYASVRALL